MDDLNKLNNLGVSVGKGRGRVADQNLRRPFTNNPPDIGIHTYNSNEATIQQPHPVQTLYPDVIEGVMGLTLGSNFGSSLDADAPEFVPSSSFQAQTQPQFHASNNEQFSQNEQLLSEMFSPQMGYIDHPVVSEVNDLVVKLTLKPQKYDRLATQLTSILSYRASSDPNLLKEVTSVIFEQGVGEANFRFNGGRLCQHLCRNVIADNPSFKSLLLKRCQYEHSMTTYYLSADLQRLHGFTLFFADLFIHILTPGGNPLDSLRAGLYDILLLLLSHKEVSSLKCVTQVLKCSGYLLDVGDGKAKMDTVMSTMRDVSLTGNVPEHIGKMLLAVIELRAANWGRDAQVESSTSAPDLVTSQPQLNADHAEDSSSDSDDPYYGGPSGDCGNEMDEEMQRDFEEFLLNQSNGK